MKNPYEILEVEPSASEDQIKKAYRKKAQAVHPDKGGDTEEFQDVSKAYEILSNAEKREHFDKTGEEFRDEIKEEVIGALVHIVMSIIDNNDARYIDVIAIARKSVEEQQNRHQISKKQLEKQITSLENTASRITIVEGKENILRLAILSNIANLETQIAAIDKVNQIGVRILEMLSDYTYQKEDRPTNIWSATMPIWNPAC